MLRRSQENLTEKTKLWPGPWVVCGILPDGNRWDQNTGLYSAGNWEMVKVRIFWKWEGLGSTDTTE